ncbi:MAG: phosphatase PAP2 family protein [Candidatus Dasytiphilus stammeri]
MIEHLNKIIFLFLNANYHSPHWKIVSARYLAKYLIYIVPLIIIFLWCWSPKENIYSQRKIIVKSLLAISIAIFISWIIRKYFPYSRPFQQGIGYLFIKHSLTHSIPSNHGIVIFTFSIAFLLWSRIFLGLGLFFLGIIIAWSRIYLGLHWPGDMMISFLVGLISCYLAQFVWLTYGKKIFYLVLKIYRYSFYFLIRKNLIKY